VKKASLRSKGWQIASLMMTERAAAFIGINVMRDHQTNHCSPVPIAHRFVFSAICAHSVTRTVAPEKQPTIPTRLHAVLTFDSINTDTLDSCRFTTFDASQLSPVPVEIEFCAGNIRMRLISVHHKHYKVVAINLAREQSHLLSK
jgi:hypothetical protein